MQNQFALDAKDIAILEALQVDGRVPLSELGRKIGLSQPAISERVSRLEERGIISGYSAQINLKALGIGIIAIIRVKTTHEFIKESIKRFSEIPNIIEVHRVTGEDCFILKVLVPEPEALEAIVDRVAALGSVNTALVLRSEAPKVIGGKLINGRA